MMYTTESHIINVKDIQTFFHYLVYEKHMSFHPDDDFHEYANFKTNELCFTKEEAVLFNRLITESFNICDNQGIDIYEIGFNQLHGYLEGDVA